MSQTQTKKNREKENEWENTITKKGLDMFSMFNIKSNEKKKRETLE